MEEIAIIGIGCRVPGADNIDEFWRVLVNSENHIIDVPEERWNNDAFYSENRDEAGKTYVKKAGFIKGHDEWDNKFFGVSDTEAINVDPQQGLVLECTQMALEDAGLTKGHIQKTQTGVYIGVMNEDYKGLNVFEHKDDTNYSATGLSSTIISARVSYFYDLRGPCMVVDTACSSSMIAIHLGSQAIRTGDCEMAICGGVNCMLSPDQFMTLCKAKMLSPTGQCQSFCDTADGYGRGEGCGIVIVKSYEKAVRDGNKIWGIIKTASNQDGRAAQPITAPSGEQQKELLKKMYRHYGVDATTLQYIEAHGTGTAVGDPTEVNALGAFIAQYRSDKTDEKGSVYSGDESVYTDSTIDTQTVIDINSRYKPQTKSSILIGSVKSNIGHLESAAGVAGLIKVLLMMKNGKYVPSLHVKKDKSNINRKIALDLYGLDVSVAVTEWLPNDDGDRICCVNCFGFGGSNTHAIVIQKKSFIQGLATTSDKLTDLQYRIICISNVSTNSLKSKLQVFSEDLEKSDLALQDVSFTSVFHRDHFTYRTLLFGRTSDEIQQHATRTKDNLGEIETKKPINIIFVFCGVGTTWTGMCKEMMSTHSTFRKMVSRIDEILQPLTGWSMAEKFQDNTDYSDPFLNHIAIFCTQVALFELWKSWGIHPKAIVGQSVGEVAAAFASGALHLEDAIQVIFHRSKILSKMTGGKMMVVGNIAIEKVESLCRNHGDRVTVAVYSSPLAGTVSGDADAVDLLKEDLQKMNQNTEADIMITPLSVQCAYHSHHMGKCTEEIQSQLKNITKGRRETDHYSTVTGQLARENDFQTGKYWAENIRKPVLFMNALLQSTEQTAMNVFVELGPRQVLRAHLKNILGENLKGVCLPSMNVRKECQSIYSSLGKLYELGADINWKELVPFEGHITPIPRHVFQKSKVLHIPKRKQMFMKGIQKNSDSHMFLRQGINGKAEFHLHLDKETSPFVYDHYMYHNVLVPGATYVEAAFEIGLQKSCLHVSEMEISIEFVNTLWPKDNKKCEADVDVTSTEPNKYQFEISQKDKLLCKGQITPRLDYTRKTFNVVEIKSRCQTLRTKDQNYECLNRLHFQYGETLRVIENSWSSDVECIVELKIPDSVVGQRKVTHIHPCIIDGLFQIIGILGTNSTDGPALPKGVASFVIDRPPQQNMFGYSQLVKSVPTGNHYNFFLLSLDGQVIAKVNDFYIKKVTDKTSDSEQNTRHSLVWREITVQMNDACSERDSKKEGVTAVFASEKFISFYKQLNKYNTHFFGIETDDVFGLMQKDMHSLDSILFAPAYHIKDIKAEGKVMFDSVKRSFSLLSRLFSTLRQMGVRKRVFVVTENVIGLQQTTNVCGSELWGMVRSALIEGSATDVKLIDMTFTSENGLALQTVIQDHEITHNEFLIENGKVHFCEVLEADDQTVPLRRRVHFEMSENALLKTSSPHLVKRPFFDVTFNEPVQGENSQQHKIRLEEICLHDSSVFLTSLGQEDDTFSTEEDIGHAVVCIEGTGRKQCNTSTEKTKVGFCFPVNASAVISVPSKCTFDPETMTKYIPGMFTVGVIIWNIAAACMQSKNVLCIVDDNSSLFVQLIRNLFSARTNCLLSIVTQAGSLEFLTRRQFDSCTVVILAKLPFNQFERIASGFPAVQKLICIEGFISKRDKMLVTYTNENMKLHIFQIENMFSQAKLIECVPKIFNSFRSTKTNLKQTANAEKGIFSLPYPVLKFENKNGNARIPMMVSKDNVFRTNGCYIVVGGLTGLGWELVQYMANLGAKAISTFSRRRPDNHKENDIQRTWDRYSCRIIPVQVDITDIHQLRKGMKTLLSALDNHVKIRGVLHGGGVTCDKFLKDMTEEDIDQVLMPKVLGTWNLHEVTRDMELDFFIMHSSVVSVFGNQGQCNYAAGNSFQDSFAHYRRSIGLCGQSINWTALSLGMATENQLLEKYLNAQGFFYLSKEEIRECFMLAVMANQSQMMFGKFDWQKMQQNEMVRLNPTKFENILKMHSAFSKNTDVHAKKDEINVLSRKDPVQLREVLLELVKSKIVETFVVDENTLTESTQIVSLGIDSMAAMSFTNVIFDVTNVRIPIGTTFFDESATIGSVASYIQTRMQGDTNNNQPTVTPNEERLKEYLTGDITFMQKTLLDDFVKDPFSPNIIRQVDFEIKGLEIRKNDMKLIVYHLVKINPDLRRIFKIEKQLTNMYQPVFLDISDVDIEIKDTDFDMICQDDSADERRKIKIDITKDLPIKVMMATRKDTTRIRIYVHAVLGDLSGITNLFIDIAHIFQCHFQQKELPVKATDIDLAEAVRRTILPQSHELTRFWNNCFQRDIEPFTLSSDINDQLDEQYWKDLTLQVPTDVVTQMMNFINNQSISVYHFITSTYMVLLHEKTGKYLIPLVTYVDMRTHVKQLQPTLQRCSNAIPVIGDLREMGLLSTYLKKSSHQLIETLQHSAYPYELIQKEMVSDDLRKHIGRHRFIMENMTSVRNYLKQDGVELRIGKLYYKRHVYETTLHVEYDTLQNVVTLHFGYNGKAISDRAAEQILDRLLHLITVFVQSPHKEVKVLLKETSHDVERPDQGQHSNSTEDDSRLNLGKELKTLEETLSSSTTEAILDMPREASKQELIYKGKFAKQTTKGWEHSVQLKLVRVISAENNRELILTWGTGRKMRIIHTNHISEVEIKRTSEMVYVVVKTYARSFIFKSPTLRQAKDWLEVFKQADREDDIKNRQEMICHF